MHGGAADGRDGTSWRGSGSAVEDDDGGERGDLAWLRLRRLCRRCLCAPYRGLASDSLHTELALDALDQALYDRTVGDGGALVHHSDHGAQYLSIRYTERLAEAGIEPSVGRVGDSYDNALAEFIIGLYKTEVIRQRGPWRHRGRVRHPRMGRLVQPPPTPGRDRLCAACRTRRNVLSAVRRVDHGGLTHTNPSPVNPGRFNSL